jgi:glycerophosphoryl diester phosphodiesterase
VTPTLAQPSSRPLILAHRGASAEAPENTIEAFDLALRQGADGIELDVRISSDGVPVVIHDARLERTTNGAGRVDALSARELGRLDAGTWLSTRRPALVRSRFRSLRIPLLSEALAWMKEQGCVAYVELKRGRASNGGLEEKVLRVIRETGMVQNVVVISFHHAVLQTLRELDRRIALGLDFTRPLLALRRAQAVGATAVLPLGALVTSKFVHRAHALGLKVVPWGADSPRSWRRLLAIGVDGLITNRPAALQRTVELAMGARVKASGGVKR